MFLGRSLLEAVVRFVCDSFICLHFIGWPAKWDERLDRIESGRVADRGTHTKGPLHQHFVGEQLDFVQRCYPNLEIPVSVANSQCGNIPGLLFSVDA